MCNPMTALIVRLRRFMARREGNTAIIFGLAAIPVVIAAGMAVDVTRAYMVKERLSAALDAAALAVGSEGSLTQAQLQTMLTNYFFANYPSTSLGTNVTVQPLDTTSDPNANLASQIVNYQAKATVNMTFMQLAGVSSITVTTTAQTHRGVGLEIALVLDNTGSMLCGNSDGAPNYSDSLCVQGVVTSDTSCSNTGNLSRICQLRQGALDFLNILSNASPAPGQLYISVVPYVTTVNISTLCSSQFNCGHTTTGPTTSGTCATSDFTDQYGYIVDAPFTVFGNVSTTTIGGTQYGLVNVTSGNLNNVAVGMIIQQLYTTASSSNSVWDPMPTTNGGVIPTSPSVATIQGINNGGTVQGVTPPGANEFVFLPVPTGSASNALIQFGFTGNTIRGSSIVTGVPTAVATALNATSTLPGSPPFANAWTVSAGLGTSASSAIPVGTAARGNPERETTVSAATVSGGSATVTLCQNAIATGTQDIMLYNPIWYDSSASPAPGSSSAATNPASAQWMGCVVELTSSDEMTGVSGVLAYSGATDPDVTEPSPGESWYPFWWLPGDSNNGNSGLNNWIGGTNFSSSTGNAIVAQTNASEVQGAVTTDWDHYPGPNQGCPVPILPLTDVTASAGVTQVQNTINQMWPRDAGGTQVGVGMIWGWRTLSPNGPFPQNNGHPMTYAQETSQAWKKVVVLMTDGTEEWPSQDQLTGMGFLQDGKLGTTSFSGPEGSPTPDNNIDSRLQQLCKNMALTGDFVIFTIGLGTDGASNTTLQECATDKNNIAGVNNGGSFTAATTSNLDATFQSIANQILTLRLSQ
jgi:Flp pilus assembly protein TadG